MSEHAQAENPAVAELGALVGHLADELASFRRRALTAESKLKELEGVEGGAVNVDLAQRCSKLEQDNERLQVKLEAATTRAKQMLDRVKFLRQQAQLSGADR
ncbi:MAG TPA: hypothetical protein VGM50_20840 [Gemmatimonadaceae bacterium]|jgi:hypothetical protein